MAAAGACQRTRKQDFVRKQVTDLGVMVRLLQDIVFRRPGVKAGRVSTRGSEATKPFPEGKVWIGVSKSDSERIPPPHQGGWIGPRLAQQGVAKTGSVDSEIFANLQKSPISTDFPRATSLLATDGRRNASSGRQAIEQVELAVVDELEDELAEEGVGPSEAESGEAVSRICGVREAMLDAIKKREVYPKADLSLDE